MKAVLFDLDNTLYSPERELFSLIDVRINSYMTDVVGIPAAEVDEMRRRYWREYGATLQGLIRHYGIDPEDYLEYVHDIDVSSRLCSDPLLRVAIEGMTLRKAVFTNGSDGHARRVLATLGLTGLFEEIFDIRVAAYLPKPSLAPYHKVLERMCLPGEHCIMVEDSVENLRTAKGLGMGTILVGSGDPPPYVDIQVATAAEVPLALSQWLG
jgi:putative hydrolase of the HAD superfamily